MKILVLAPHPFYEERGTPIACKLLCETLLEQGHEIDLLTYTAGENIEAEGLNIIRIPDIPIFNLKKVTIGLSGKKIICDVLMAFKLIQLLHSNNQRYDAIHAGEEAVFLGLFLSYFHHTPSPIIYDMDSSMADQVVEKFPQLSPLSWFLDQMETYAFGTVQWIFPVCQALKDKITINCHRQTNIELLQDIYFEPESTVVETEKLKNSNSRDSVKQLLLYVGNLEKYQGIDLLLESLVELNFDPEIQSTYELKLIGGKAEDIQRYEQKTIDLGVQSNVTFLGPRPVDQLPLYLQQADILLSPRTKGGNTPMKLYSYLASGVPIVATRIRSHTQAVDNQSAVLVETTPKSMADGILNLLNNQSLRKTIGTTGKQLAIDNFSYKAYQRKLNRSYQKIANYAPGTERSI